MRLTRRGEFVGGLAVTIGLIAVMGFFGWIEALP